MDITDLGLTQEQLQERVIERMCEMVMSQEQSDDGDYHYVTNSAFSKALHEKLKEGIEADVTRLANVHVLPHVTQFIEDLQFQRTSKWGEADGKPFSFTEYLVERAKAYMAEEVDHNGKVRPNRGDYSHNSWSAESGRLAYLMDKRLRHEIASAIKQILGAANETVVESIKTTIEAQVKQIVGKIKVEVK